MRYYIVTQTNTGCNKISRRRYAVRRAYGTTDKALAEQHCAELTSDGFHLLNGRAAPRIVTFKTDAEARKHFWFA